ncbi:hypothetical protein ABZN20_09715 [Methylococcus sp. ANG]|uniref:hypothetical protein n=1 Tax=Methylococcus sp. ANG TaxID=3231903 RepID=UPI00345AF8CE
MKIKLLFFAAVLIAFNCFAAGRLLYEKTETFGAYGNSLQDALLSVNAQASDWCSKSWVSCAYFDPNSANCNPTGGGIWLCVMPVTFKVYQAQ